MNINTAWSHKFSIRYNDQIGHTFLPCVLFLYPLERSVNFSDKIPNIGQKRSSGGVLCIRCSQRFRKIYRKNLCQSLHFNKVAGLRSTRLWHRCFPVNFSKFLRAPFLTEHLRWLLLNLTLSQYIVKQLYHREIYGYIIVIRNRKIFRKHGPYLAQL